MAEDTLDTFVAPRYRSAGRRPEGRNDRRAAADAPLALLRGIVSGALGAPGDIESLVRLLPYLDKETVLPTSEDVEKRLPLRSVSQTPAGRAFTEVGKVGGGGYTGPGSPLRAIGALPSALKRAAGDFAVAAGGSGPSMVEQKMLQGLYRGYAGDLPETVYHAGVEFKDAPRPGTFVSKDKKAVEQFGQAVGAKKLHTFDAKPRRGGDESDVYKMAKRLGIYEEGVPAGQYLEQGENAVYPEAAQMAEELHNMGLDHLLLDDGLSKTPSMVILDPEMVTRNSGVFLSPQRRVADYYAQKRAAQTGESPHAEMVLVDPFAGEKYSHSTLGTGAHPPLTTQARKIEPSEIVERTQLYAAGGLVQPQPTDYDPQRIDALAQQLRAELAF